MEGNPKGEVELAIVLNQIELNAFNGTSTPKFPLLYTNTK